eukprot:2423314-Ditylum_brightwellii.AAC.1
MGTNAYNMGTCWCLLFLILCFKYSWGQIPAVDLDQVFNVSCPLDTYSFAEASFITVMFPHLFVAGLDAKAV